MYFFQLPLKVDIIKHANEIDGKSTAVHAAILAPDDVTIYTYPCVPDYSPDENVRLCSYFSFVTLYAFDLKYFCVYMKHTCKFMYRRALDICFFEYEIQNWSGDLQE